MNRLSLNSILENGANEQTFMRFDTGKWR